MMPKAEEEKARGKSDVIPYPSGGLIPVAGGKSLDDNGTCSSGFHDSSKKGHSGSAQCSNELDIVLLNFTMHSNCMSRIGRRIF